MRLVRPLATIVALGVVAAALAGCAAGSAPQWTFSPTPTPTVAPSVAATQAPGASAAATGAPAGSAAASPASSGGGGGGAAVVLKIAASGVAYDTTSLEAPANTPFQIAFTNNDAGIPHNVSIHKDSARPGPRSGRARSSAGWTAGPTTCRPFPRGPTASSAPSTRT